ncbi:hypothetical protein CAI21_01035 [Alkalilimnicola ehrlichii]|uniref:YecA family protein n=1 Tax=Alkalilimnicola ehrlichii TaxID=351052 RepID=A0A3E0X1V9_9GAMM|nr:UPF0149 family protein [Alkalilimnicola ehrlichii]RFA31256.1 hypothetical protein CAI21_01035 [Alkalilimnicola ehrlichii]RFA39467.1 hypothetical protein CAL65_01380 [Alkalilimnicola ehrlichii]
MQGNDAFERVERALAGVDAEFDAAQSHGMLCGMLSAPNSVKPAAWIAQVLVNTEPKGEPAQFCLTELAALFERTVAEMDDANLEFQLLLPDDSAPITARASALGNWCDGFLYGMGMSSLKPDMQLPREVSEALRDMGEIAQVEINPDAEEENEQAYAQLVEYVRVAALLIMETLRPTAKPTVQPKNDRTLH